VGSIALAAVLAMFSASPTVLVLAVAVGTVTGALMVVRHTPQHRRALVQWALAALVVVGLTVAFLLRHPIIRWMGAGSDFSMRADLWNGLLDFAAYRRLQGWGWFGGWKSDEYPFNALNYLLRQQHESALNAYFDVLLQLGVVGLLFFLLLGGIALVRSWLVASTRRSVVYAWTPLILVTLAIDSMFESFTLVGVGWFMLVLCALRAGQSRSWRESIDAANTGAIPTLPNQG
jgi:O-antigen ligase